MQRKKLKVTFQNPLHNFNLKYHNMYEVPVLYYINYINFCSSLLQYCMYRYGTGTRSVLLSVKAGGIERMSHHHAFLRSSLGCVRWATGSRRWAAARRRRGSSACAVGSDRVGDTYLSLTLINLK